MEQQLKTSMTRVILKTALMGLSMISALVLLGQERKAVLQNATLELPKNFSEAFNPMDPDGISDAMRVYFQKEVQPYSVTGFGGSSYDKYNSSQGTVAVIQAQRIDAADTKFGENNAIYLCTEFNIGNYFGGEISLNYIRKEKYSLKIGYTEHIRKPRSQPKDYKPGAVDLLFFGVTDPLDQFNTYQIAVGKIIRIDQDETVRVNMSVGLAISTLIEPENWEKKSDIEDLKANYNWNYKKNSTVSLIINPKIEFPFSRIYGITFSPMLQINKDRIYYGVGIGQMIGLLRDRKNKL